MKMKLSIKLLFGCLTTPLAFAATGIGEYRFGPDTTENYACEMAEIRAKENAISNYLGETIESNTIDSCVNKHCIFEDQTFLNSKGYIKNVSNFYKSVNTHEGYKSCVVKITANVDKIKSNIKFNVNGKLDYVYGERMDLSFVTNKPGYVYVFNYFGHEYSYILNSQIFRPNDEIKLNQLTAQLPKYLDFSKELLVFVFAEKPIENIRGKYTANELKNVISSIPIETRSVVYRYFTIKRKI
jgi:hypothetical protein